MPFLDVKWWNEDSLVIGRFSGGVTIVSLKNMDKNMLGDSAEFFAGNSHLSPCFGKGFFVLEREITNKKQRQNTDPDLEFEDLRVESSDDEEEDENFYVRSKKVATNLAYSIHFNFV